MSRGDGEIGELITENLKTINDIPQKIKHKDFPDDIDIRGEVFITNKDFEKLKDKFANARNAASGSLRQKDPGQTKKFHLDSLLIALDTLIVIFLKNSQILFFHCQSGDLKQVNLIK